MDDSPTALLSTLVLAFSWVLILLPTYRQLANLSTCSVRFLKALQYTILCKHIWNLDISALEVNTQNGVLLQAIHLKHLPSFSSLIGFSPLRTMHVIASTSPSPFLGSARGRGGKGGKFYANNFCPAAWDIFYLPKHIKRLRLSMGIKSELDPLQFLPTCSRHLPTNSPVQDFLFFYGGKFSENFTFLRRLYWRHQPWFVQWGKEWGCLILSQNMNFIHDNVFKAFLPPKCPAQCPAPSQSQ